MALINPSIPTLGDFNSTEDPDVRNGMITIRDEFNGNIDNTNIKAAAGVALNKLASGTSAQLIVCNASGVPTYVTSSGDVTTDNAGVLSIGTDKVVTSKILNANVTDAKLASPNNGVYRTLLSTDIYISGLTTTGHYSVLSGGTPVPSGNNVSGAPIAFAYDANAAFTVSGMTQKWRIVCGWQTNGTALGTSVFTANLYPVTSVGGSGGNVSTTLTTGSPVCTKSLNGGATPGTNASNTGEASVEVNSPAAGLYYPGLQIGTAALATSSCIALHFELQHRYV